MMRRQTFFVGALLLAACSSPTEAKKTAKTPVVPVKPEAPKDAPEGQPKVRIKRKPNQAPNGDVASIVTFGARVEIKSTASGKRTLDADSLHPPAGERGLIGIGAMATTYLDDGTLLVGVGDGTLIALDANDKRKWSIGFRGGVTGITLADDERVVITTQRGVVASVTTTGQILWEKHLVSGALTPAVIGADDNIYVAGPRGVLAFSPDGTLVFSHAVTLDDEICCNTNPKEAFSVDASGHITARGLDIRVSDPHPAIVSTDPVILLSYEKVLDEKISAVVSSGPDELLLLAHGKKGAELLRYSGGKAKRFPLPSRTAKADRMSEDDKLEKLSIEYDTIALGPNGNPWLLGRSIFPVTDGGSPWWSRPAKAIILELAGTTVRERNDLAEAFAEHWVSTNSDTHIRATETGTARIFCFGFEDNNACAIYDGGQPEIIKRKVKTTSVNVVGKHTYVVPDYGNAERLQGRELVPIPTPEDKRYGISAIGGTGDDDLWFTGAGAVAYHYDGKTFTATSVPQSIEQGVVAVAPNDVWSRDGQVHWDGKRWSIVANAPVAAGIVVRGPNDVWVGNGDGLFRGKPSSLTSVHLPEAKSVDSRPLDAPKPLTLGGPLAGYDVAKTAVVVKNAAPVSTAKRVEVARDGTLWLEAWDRLVEMDVEGKTAVIDSEEKRIRFERWFYPEGPGRGIFAHRDRETESYNERDKLRRFEGGKAVDADMKLGGNDIVAISGNSTGAVWILGSVEAGSPYSLQRSQVHELGVHALVRADEKSPFQPVIGLPALAYVDVAVTPEGGGFFVGALNAGPMGEGFLLHARGRLGTERVSRHRAPAALLAVAAVSNDEAWAVGSMGLVLHAKGNAVERHVVPSGAWLRAVVANGPNDVWIGGDDGTLLHYDGKAFQPVPHPLGSHASISGLGISRGVVWAVGPSGILRVTKTGAPGK
ncbi:MAG: PQQ-binding-like beta-propeller repeat protein [Polyangiaceae bacterium]|nr:PQQ-binding-like beta-propeller repeat protein [Polyangiaceae bacterium]